MPLVQCEKLTIRHPALSPAPGLTPLDTESTPAPAILPNNNFFQEFMQMYIDKVRNQTPIAPTAKAREKALNKSLKSKNPNLYYGYLYIECYFFCQ